MCCDRRLLRRTSTSTRPSPRSAASPPAVRRASRWPTTGCSGEPEELLAEAEATLRQWAETAEQAYREGADIAAALSARFDPLLGDIDAAHKEKLDVMNGVHSNAAGFRRWLDTRDVKPAP